MHGFWDFAQRLKAWHITRWATDSEELPIHVDDRLPGELHRTANALSSARTDRPGAVISGSAEHRARTDPGGSHALVIDLDKPAWLVPSTTYGHSHLYVDTHIGWSDYVHLLEALARAGVIEDGYAQASIAKGASYARLPWVKKGES